ncbi:MAG: hypothetical protein NTY88_12500 [Bacteroidetes bacterium]|nr:hypothetical protein [Bacteroidota bacterium]
MPQELDFIEQYFSSRKNYEVKVNDAIIGVEKYYDDSQSQSYQRLRKHGKLTDEKLRKKFRLLIALNCFENDIYIKIDKTLNHFFFALDAPADKIAKREFFLSYHKRLEAISLNIIKLFEEYKPENFDGSSPDFSITEKFFNDISFQELMYADEDVSELDNKVKALLNHLSEFEETMLKQVMGFNEPEIHSIALLRLATIINRAGWYIIGKKADLIELKGEIINQVGFPKIYLNEAELDNLFEKVKKQAEEDLAKRKVEAREIIVTKLATLNQYHRNGKKRIEDDDFKRLVDYTTHLFVTGTLPSNIKPINNFNVSVESVRFIYYTLKSLLNNSFIIEKKLVIDFLYKVFPILFSGTRPFTLSSKFSSKAPRNFPD